MAVTILSAKPNETIIANVKTTATKAVINGTRMPWSVLNENARTIAIMMITIKGSHIRSCKIILVVSIFEPTL